MPQITRKGESASRARPIRAKDHDNSNIHTKNERRLKCLVLSGVCMRIAKTRETPTGFRPTRNDHVQSAAAQDVDRGSWLGPPLDCNILFVAPVRPRPVCPWATIARPADGHLTASPGGRQSFFGAPVCRSGARTRADVLFLRGPQSSGIGSAAVGKKMEGRKMGTSSESGGSHPFFVVPGFCVFSSGFWSSGLFSGPGCLATNDQGNRGRPPGQTITSTPLDARTPAPGCTRIVRDGNQCLDRVRTSRRLPCSTSLECTVQAVRSGRSTFHERNLCQQHPLTR